MWEMVPGGMKKTRAVFLSQIWEMKGYGSEFSKLCRLSSSECKNLRRNEHSYGEKRQRLDILKTSIRKSNECPGSS